MNPPANPRLGFIGTGGITAAVVSGLFAHGEYDDPIIISERSSHRSKSLSERFGRIEIEPDNQAIVNRADWIFVAVLPDQVVGLLSELNFRPNQTVISLAASISLHQLRQLVAPSVSVCRVIPMPPIEQGIGPVVVCPPNPDVEQLFNRVGTVVAVTNKAQFTAFSASSAVMATLFEIVAVMARWLEKQNVPEQESARYATSLIHALSQMTVTADATELQQMSRECLTRGGLNEQVIDELEQLDWFGLLETRWDRILERLNTA